MENPAIAALAAKYAELKERVRCLKIEITATENSLVHVGQTLLMFDPSYPMASLHVRKSHASQKPMKDRNRLAMDVLRAGTIPLTPREIARTVLKMEGNDNPTLKVVDATATCVHSYFKRLEKRGTVRIASKEPYRWVLVKG